MTGPKPKTEPDWPKVARERLEKLDQLERQCLQLRDSIAAELARELTVQFHAYCLPGGGAKLKAIAEFVAERVRPKLFGR